MTPRVSVIVPVYNAEKHLRQCIESIMAQTLTDIEIICVDDGSTDSSLSILKELAAQDERIQVVEQANGGAGAARNNGLRLAKGDYLSFLDADDFFEPDMLELAVAKADADDADIVVFKSDQYLEDKNRYKKVGYPLKQAQLPPFTPFSYQQIAGNPLRCFVGWAWDKLFSRAFILESGLEFQEQRTSNDLYFVFSAIAEAPRITWVDKVLAHQRRNDKESLSNTREKSWMCFHDALIKLQERLKATGRYDDYEHDFIDYATHFSLWNINTIASSTYEKLYTALHDGWLEEFGIAGKDLSDFSNEKEARQIKEIEGLSYEESLVKVSVVIPIYNAQDYIRETLDSLLKEQDIALEVICVDDCSTDDTPSILAEYDEKYLQVTVLRNERNVYAGESRNRGLSVAKGKYVHFLDADDYVVKDSYSKLFAICFEYDLDFIKTTCEAFDNTTKKHIKNPRYEMTKLNWAFFDMLLDFKDYPKKFLRWMAVVPWNALYKRSFLIDNGIRFNNLYCVNDRSFFVETCLAAERMMVTDIPFVRHRSNVGSSLVSGRAKHFECQFKSYELMEVLCDKYDVSDELRFEILEHELSDLFVWYRKFHKKGALSPEKEAEVAAFVRSLDIPYFESYGERSRWLQYLDMFAD